MKNFKKICLLFIISFISTIKVNANLIDSIEMDIHIDNNGNAKIIEVWDTRLNAGTEGYRAFSNLGLSSITNFSVSDETGKIYENLSYWNTKLSFSEKAYRSGIKYTSNGVELCWGISKYGEKTYTLSYTIENFVYQYKDTQGIYFNLLNLNQEVKKVKVNIRSEIPFSLENSKIWAFGYEGEINFKNGIIEMKSDGKLSSEEYMVVLVRFEKNIFNIQAKLDKTFDSDYDSAMKDSDYLVNNENFFISFIKDSFKFIFYVMPYPIIMFLIILGAIRNIFLDKKIFVTKQNDELLDFGLYGKNLPWDYETEYFRDIPCNMDIFRAYWVLYQYNVVPIATLHEGLLGAILLKWIKNGYIKVDKDKNVLFSIKDNNYKIDLTNEEIKFDNKIEKNFFSILKKAAWPNKMLESNELSIWCENNFRALENWFYLVIQEEEKKLIEQGLIINITDKNNLKKVITKKVSNELREDGIKLQGLKKFLLDFTLMPEREYFEVHIWEEYLIFAELLGVADKVAEQFSKLYPEFIEKSNYDIITTSIIREFASSSNRGIEIGKEKYRLEKIRMNEERNYSGSSRSSGSGGSSSRGGGSSARGSSGGGFR